MRTKSILLKIVFSFFCVAVQNYLCAQSPGDIKARIASNAAKIGLNPSDSGNYIINSTAKSSNSDLEYTYIQQTFYGIKVFNHVISLSFKGENLSYASGKFADNVKATTIAHNPLVQARVAVGVAAAHLNLAPSGAFIEKQNKFLEEKKIIFSPAGIAKQDIETELVWVVDSLNKVHLAWNVNIDVLTSHDWWNVRVDALTGEVIEKDNWTVNENYGVNDNNYSGAKNLSYGKNGIPGNQAYRISNNNAERNFFRVVSSSIYNVIPYPNDSPNDAPPTIEINPWLKAGAGNNATTWGWHFDGTTYHDSTRGNNVHAYLDAANRNAPPPPNYSAKSTTPQPALTFNFTPNFSVQPVDTFTRLFAITNLFYWNNILHDITYQYGFDEPSGNFQFFNAERGGSGNDYVRAEAQDGSGTDNANFSTPADGQSGRMQMYTWSGPTTFNVTAPASVAGSYFAKESGFSTANKLKNKGTVTGQVVYYNDSTGGTHYACGVPGGPLNPVIGKIAMIIRGGGCVGGFVEKVKNAQNAGAIGVIMVNNVGGFPITMGGTDNTITIPAIMISMEDGALLAAQLNQGVTISMAAGADRDGDMDNGVVSHEFTHGVSNRLTGGRANASCLSNAEQGGEGWSDYVGLMVTTNWATAQVNDGPKPRPVGNYAGAYPVTNGPGIRRYPYSTNTLINPLTYADVATNTEVHAIGEVWCQALWDMTWNIIQQENSITANFYNGTGTGGNIIAMKLVMEGMKLQPCRPGFIDARNAILAADSILYGFKHKCAIWNAFARRGMGYSASEGLSTSATDQVVAFDVPSALKLSKAITSAVVTSGNQMTTTIQVSCQCQIPVKGFIRDTLPAGFTYVSSTTGSFVSGNVVSFAADFISSPNETKTFTVVSKATAAGCAITPSINDNRDATTVGGLTPTALVGTTNWVQSATMSKSPVNSWFAADVAGTRDFVLTSASFTTSNLSVLSFWHFYVLENTLDGGRVELSADNGTTWLDAAPFILQNRYNTMMTSASPWGVGMAYSGVSYGQDGGQFINTLVDLSSFVGQTLRVRFRMRTNASNASGQIYDGWYIDDITLNNGCGSLSKIALQNEAFANVDSMYIPAFVIGGTLPVNFTSIKAYEKSNGIQVDWNIATENNIDHYEVEKSATSRVFDKAASATAKANNSTAATYNWFDASPYTGNNYYRIRAVEKSGSVLFSQIVNVKIGSGKGEIVIYPNPVTDHTITVQLNHQPKGKYVVQVFNNLGQQMLTRTIEHTGGSSVQTIQLSNAISKGVYQLSITNGDIKINQKLICN